jgi:hypothetical protein
MEKKRRARTASPPLSLSPCASARYRQQGRPFAIVGLQVSQVWQSVW